MMTDAFSGTVIDNLGVIKNVTQIFDIRKQLHTWLLNKSTEVVLTSVYPMGSLVRVESIFETSVPIELFIITNMSFNLNFVCIVDSRFCYTVELSRDYVDYHFRFVIDHEIHKF